MTTNRRITYTDPRITHMVFDSSNEFLWIAHRKDSDGICHLKKCSATSPDQVYFDIELEVDSIADLKISGSNIYVLYNNHTLVLTKFSTSTPFTSYTDYQKPYGIPNPIACLPYGSQVIVLVSDHSGGYSPKLLFFNSNGSYDTTLNLADYLRSAETISDVVDLTTDNDNGDIWVITYGNPSKMMRVYYDGGYTGQLYTLI